MPVAKSHFHAKTAQTWQIQFRLIGFEFRVNNQLTSSNSYAQSQVQIILFFWIEEMNICSCIKCGIVAAYVDFIWVNSPKIGV